MKHFFQDHADSRMEVALKLTNKRSVVLGDEFFYVEVGVIVIFLRQGGLSLSAGLIRMTSPSSRFFVFRTNLFRVIKKT